MTEAAKRWFSAAELAALELDGYPRTERSIQRLAATENWQRPAWENYRWRLRRDRGGGVEYHFSILGPISQALVLARFPEPEDIALQKYGVDLNAMERVRREWESASPARRQEALQRVAVVRALRDMLGTGRPRTQAIFAVAHANAISHQTLYNWWNRLEMLPEGHWLAALLPKSRASAEPMDINRDAWDCLRTLYLRPERPSFNQCMRDLKAIAAEKGWTLPSDRTLRRRIEALPHAVVTKAREGNDALKRMYPAQKRSRAGLHALEWVNADGHEFDVFVRWDDGTVGRPVMVAFQDVYSAMLLSWRVDRSEHSDLVRLAYGDMVSLYGIPYHVLLDNGRAFASKKITGGTPNRYRFKVRKEEPEGVITACGSEVHWATPYAGQSKPIERAFGDLAHSVAKHPAFAGAYVGNRPDAKPENYGSKAIPIEDFMCVLRAGIAEHNTRRGRRTEVCGGVKSFREAFEESLKTAAIRRPSEKQERLWLLAAEEVKPRKPDGAIHLMGNRYWHPDISLFMGKPLVVRFDPQALHDGVAVYQPNGHFLFDAPVIEAAGFADADKARQHARDRRAWMRATAEAERLERRLTIQEVAAMLPHVEPMPPPEPTILRPVFGRGATALQATPVDAQSENEIEVLTAIRRLTAGRLHLVQPEDGSD